MPLTFAGRSCIDPLALADACRDQNLPTDWLSKANTFHCPLGRGPGRGWVLLRRADLDAVALTADQELAFADDAGHRTTFRKITLVGAQCVTPGAPDDGQRAYLCELVDRRHHLARVPIDAAYNVRSPCGSDLYSDYLTHTT